MISLSKQSTRTFTAFKLSSPVVKLSSVKFPILFRFCSCFSNSLVRFDWDAPASQILFCGRSSSLFRAVYSCFVLPAGWFASRSQILFFHLVTYFEGSTCLISIDRLAPAFDILVCVNMSGLFRARCS